MNADAEARRDQLIGSKIKDMEFLGEIERTIASKNKEKKIQFRPTAVKSDRNDLYNMTNKIKVKIITDWSLLANMPTKSHESDAGWDLYSVEELDLQPGERHAVYTGVAFEIPNGYAGLIWPRSGMSVKKGIDVLAGVVDSGYRGEIKVCLLNTGQEPCIIKKGDRIAQIIFQEVPKFNLEIVDEFSNSDRGEGGFGSTGF